MPTTPTGADRIVARHWYLPLVGGLLPLLLVGLVTSGLANRLAFAYWALAAAFAYTFLLRHALAREWPAARRRGALFLTQGVAWGIFALLVARHREIFDLGFRAFLPDLYAPWATRPETAGAVAAILLLTAAASVLASRRRRA